jgi:hypothetical protein
MRSGFRQVPAAAACALLAATAAATPGDDDKDADPNLGAAQPSLTGEQQRAVGILIAHPVAAQAPERIEALGQVLDATLLIADLGESAAAGAAEQAASTEVERLRSLNAGGAGASLKMIEAAQVDHARAHAQAQLAAARFALHWSALAAMPVEARQRVIDAAASGRSLLLRADLPGRHTLGALPAKAVVDVDGIQVPGRVLGSLRQTTELQSAALLIEVPSAPGGLGPGARVPVALLTAQRTGLLLPHDALLYDENGAYVYKQLAKHAASDPTRYARVKVSLLLPFADGWLVDGVDNDDEIVVHGAGVLWSLQGVGARQSDDDD